MSTGRSAMNPNIISQAYQNYVTPYQARYYELPPLYATTEPQ